MAAKGKVVLVPFPFDDLSATKVRPAVCLTEPVGPHRHLVLAFITSQIPADVLETDLSLHPTDSEFAATGLRVASTLRLHRLMTVTASVVLRELGSLAPSTQARMEQKRRRLFELP